MSRYDLTLADLENVMLAFNNYPGMRDSAKGLVGMTEPCYGKLHTVYPRQEHMLNPCPPQHAGVQCCAADSSRHWASLGNP